MNNITKLVNKLQNFVVTNEDYKDKLVSNLQYRLKLLKEELLNVKYAIHWAKSNIINTIMLSAKEIKIVTNTLDKERLPYFSPEEALEFASVKVIGKDTSLLYIINIPLTTEETYDTLIIKPVKRNNFVIDVPRNVIINQNKNEIFAVVNNCNTYNFMSICKKKNLLNLRNNTCIKNILKSLVSECDKINGQHIPTIEEISPGVLLINNFAGSIKVDTTPRHLNGTFLIKFSNSTININDQEFTAVTTSTIQALPAILQPAPREKQYRELLSLEMMKDLHINNTNRIEALTEEGNIQRLTSYSLGIVIIIFIIIMIFSKLTIKKGTKVIVTPPTREASNNNESKDESAGSAPLELTSPNIEAQHHATTFYEPSFF